MFMYVYMCVCVHMFIYDELCWIKFRSLMFVVDVAFSIVVVVAIVKKVFKLPRVVFSAVKC